MVRRTWVVLLALVAVLSVACSNEPVQQSVPTPQATPSPTAAPPGTPTQIVVGVDDLPAGFNPHLLADTSPVGQAVATLVLPSVFRTDAAGVPQLDPSVATSAQVTSEAPFTVSYELNLEASWSTNAPIAAEDFVYLWERMRAEPGVVDAGGYRLITAVRSRAGGKAVDVEFAHPYPAWQGLFSGLLPAHLLKDAPGSWIGASRGGLPASGGPFKVNTVDRGRGEVVLVRNDLYWDAPSAVDQLVLRRLDVPGLAGGIASGDLDLAVAAAGPTLQTALSEVVPAPRTQTAPRAEIVTLGLRADAGPLRSAQARQAIAGVIDREAVRAAVAPDALAADAFLRAPSEPGYAASAPARPDAAAVTELLTQAGWTRSGQTWSADGRPVRLVIGAGAERPLDQEVAAAVAEQLSEAGIPTTVVAPSAVDLYGSDTVPATPPSTSVTPTPTPSASAPTTGGGASGVTVDLMVLPRAAGGDPATSLASEFGCTLPAADGSVARTESTPGPTGYCQPLLDVLLDELMRPDPRAGLDADVDRLLWTEAAALPLFQPVGLIASTSEADALTGVAPGSLQTGPLAGAARWRPPPP